MATTATNPHLISLASYTTWPATSALSGSTASTRSRAVTHARRRRIPFQEGRAIEMLGHAIEYLGDEFALDCMNHTRQSEAPSSVNPIKSINAINSIDPRIVAIHLLMARNREIYLSCPEIPSLGERLRMLFHFPHSTPGRPGR